MPTYTETISGGSLGAGAASVNSRESKIPSGGCVIAGSIVDSLTGGTYRAAFVARRYNDTIYVTRNNEQVRCVIMGLNLDSTGVIESYVTNKGIITILDYIFTPTQRLAQIGVNVNDNDNVQADKSYQNCLL